MRAELYRIYTLQIRQLDPDNQELFSLTDPNWVPSWGDVNRASYALDVARWTKQAENGALDLPPTEWERGWAARGQNVNRIRGETLPPNHLVIDDFTNGVARSIKSIDLNAPTYLDPARL